ncbi:nucleotidyltransferase substrate binding protein [bacterium]|nr:nucleotidyltransferase substrate binding protein [bacterium]
MPTDKYNRNLKSFEKALLQLGDALEESESPIVRDACLQRFEFCYELLWKTLRVFLEDIHGVRAVSPRQVFKEAFALSIIDEELTFVEMIESRNTLAHTYNEEQATKIYVKCAAYLEAMKNVLAQLNKQS